ncbi:MAG: hypothetical protein V4695_05855 [Pseudomonadota bacterium]
MIGFLFLGVALLWLVLTVFLTIKIPRWLDLKSSSRWLLRLALVPLLLVGPFVDEIVGMRQFKRLCEERAVFNVHPNSNHVNRAKEVYTDYTAVPGYWIDITSQKVSYIDLDTGIAFLSYEVFFTKGGRIAGIALMGGKHACSTRNKSEFDRLKIEQLIEQGKRS